MENLDTMAVDCDTFDLSLLPLLPVQVSTDDTPFGSSVQISTPFESSYMPLEPVQVSTNDTDFVSSIMMPLNTVPPVSTDNSSFDTSLLTLPVSTDDTADHNPWALGKLEKFLYYCCPECDEKNPSQDAFLQHALNEHPKAKEYFGEFHIKKEIIDDLDDDNSVQVEQNKINVNIYYDSTSHMNCSILGKFKYK